MKQLIIHTSSISKNQIRLIFPLFCLLLTQWSFAQQLSATADTTAIKIGEQILYKITVEADSTDLVVFPEGQTFAPLEMVEHKDLDTLRKDKRITLQRQYALTQFDSGNYTLPRQKILIGDRTLFTDSLRITVADVKVDTIAQRMYDIKPIIGVKRNFSSIWLTILIVVLCVAAIAAALYWFVFRKKPLTEEEKVALLPPYDRALLELKNLENSKYLIQSEYKAYYSELTNIVRQYLEEDVKVSALESTTDELIEKLTLLKDAGSLDIDKDTIAQFQKILQTADLVKFARSTPDTKVAELHRTHIEDIVVKTKEALPEPTEEELLENEAYLEELAQKRKKKHIKLAIVSSILLVLLGIGGAIGYYGFKTVKDTVFGHPTKSLLEGEWVNSEYGFPPLILETPVVLERKEITLPPEAKANVQEMQVFAYESTIGLFTIVATTTSFNGELEVQLEKAVEGTLKELENKGLKNIITKKEEFSTVSGVTGLKTFGKGDVTLPGTKESIQGEYVMLHFGGKGFIQQLIISWKKDDTYAEEIVNRILNSVDVKKQI